MDLINWLKEKGPAIVESIGKSVTIFADWLKTNGPTIINTIVSGIKIMRDTLEPLWNQLVAVMGPIFKELFGPFFTDLLNYLKAIFQWVLDNVFAPIGVYFKETLGPWIGELAKNLVAYIGNLFKAELEHIFYYVGQVLKAYFFSPWGTSDDQKKSNISAAMSIYNEAHKDTVNLLVPPLAAMQAVQLTELPKWVTTTKDQTDKIVGAIKDLKDEVVKASSVSSGGGTGGFAPHDNSVRQQQACGAPDGASSNAAQTNNVMYLARKKIYEELTGKQYLGI
jgi:hypothetical protein